LWARPIAQRIIRQSAHSCDTGYSSLLGYRYLTPDFKDDDFLAHLTAEGLALGVDFGFQATFTTVHKNRRQARFSVLLSSRDQYAGDRAKRRQRIAHGRILRTSTTDKYSPNRQRFEIMTANFDQLNRQE
jgi:hypothetical protein